MATTSKSIRVGERSMQLLDALRIQLGDQYLSEAALLNEATRRGLLLLAVEAWHARRVSMEGIVQKSLHGCCAMS